MNFECLTAAPAETHRRLLAHFNHTMRTPLNTICGLCDLLRSEDGLPQEQSLYLEAIYADGHRMLHYIEALSELLWVPPAVASEPVPLSELTELVEKITGGALIFLADDTENDPPVPCAPVIFRHAFQHLWNHIAWGMETPRAEISWCSAATSLVIRDYGHPLPPELSELAFLPFGLSAPTHPDLYAPLELPLARHWAERGAMQLQLTETNPDYTGYELTLPVAGGV